MSEPPPRPRPVHLVVALGTGSLLSLMVLCNAEITRAAGPILGSLCVSACNLDP